MADYKEKYIVGLEARLALMKEVQAKDSRIAQLENMLLNKDAEIEKLHETILQQKRQQQTRTVSSVSSAHAAAQASPASRNQSIQANLSTTTTTAVLSLPPVNGTHLSASAKENHTEDVTMTTSAIDSIPFDGMDVQPTETNEIVSRKTTTSARASPTKAKVVMSSPAKEPILPPTTSASRKSGRMIVVDSEDEAEPALKEPSESDRAEKVKEIEAKYGELTSWREVLRQSHPGSLSHVRKHHKELIKYTFEEFLLKNIGYELGPYCLLPMKPNDTTLEVALPSELYDDFQEYFVDRIDNGLFDTNPDQVALRKRPFDEARSGKKRKYSEANQDDTSEWATWYELLRKKYPNYKFAAYGNVFATKYFSSHDIPVKMSDKKRLYPMSAADDFIKAFEEKFSTHPQFVSFLADNGGTLSPPHKVSKFTAENHGSPENNSGDHDHNATDQAAESDEENLVEFGTWRDLVRTVMDGRFDDLKASVIQDIDIKTRQFLESRIGSHGFTMNDCDMASIDNPEKSELWVPKPLWNEYLNMIEETYHFIKKQSEPIEIQSEPIGHVTPSKAILLKTSPSRQAITESSSPNKAEAKVPDNRVHHRQSAPVFPSDLETKPDVALGRKSVGMTPNPTERHDSKSLHSSPSVQPNNAPGDHNERPFPPSVGYATVMRYIYPSYNNLPKSGRVEMKKKVRLYLAEKLGANFNDCVVVGNRDGRPHHTYAIAEHMQDEFVEWAQKELKNQFDIQI